MKFSPLYRDTVRRMQEPDDVKRLRRQAEAIEDRHRRERDKMLYDIERDCLRRRIIDAGEKPCC